jgi:hypothetical protein
MKLSHLITALVFTTSAGAFAMHCPLDMKKLNAVPAQGPSLSVDDLARANVLRAAGEAMCIRGIA